ncbi:hypothetical protein P154DRAFT_539993 [Amniculicola lignicola CBS 123094]|uniref:Uncharacterized protein n=1 Tax=Amniculicola lignicola CBS 123094 TaxID=1392246 RepID=A0A6A5VWL4_9PLEO|nr:hypothetical protein P154DRAFT_539993 [Amniculicola lignicola CBS 123094]
MVTIIVGTGKSSRTFMLTKGFLSTILPISVVLSTKHGKRAQRTKLLFPRITPRTVRPLEFVYDNTPPQSHRRGFMFCLLVHTHHDLPKVIEQYFDRIPKKCLAAIMQKISSSGQLPGEILGKKGRKGITLALKEKLCELHDHSNPHAGAPPPPTG